MVYLASNYKFKLKYSLTEKDNVCRPTCKICLTDFLNLLLLSALISLESLLCRVISLCDTLIRLLASL